MAAVAENMHDVSETVMGLNVDMIEPGQGGYGWVKTPSRHVRTRLYFTSESHVHALVNTLKNWTIDPAKQEKNNKAAASTLQAPTLPLREGQGASSTSDMRALDGAVSGGDSPSTSAAATTQRSSSPSPQPAAAPLRRRERTRLVSDGGGALLEALPELDYLTHIVFRLYENFSYKVGHPKRHRVEIMCSPGASFSPFDGLPRSPRVGPAAAEAATSGLSPFELPLPPPALASPSDSPRALSAAASSIAPASSSVGALGADGLAPSMSPKTAPKVPAAFTGPAFATRDDLDAHTLPVAPLYPLSTNLTLAEFEDVLAEAIFAGADKGDRHSSDREGGPPAMPAELYPKDEARVRFEAAVARARAGDRPFPFD
jgi:hypothetical protein